MKKYVDHLLRVLEGISGRLLHLENTTQRLERSVEVLKADGANNHGESDGKLRMLENSIKEVQSGVQILRDKQEISEAQSQLVKLQLVKSEAPTSATSAMAPVEVLTQPSNVSHGQQAELLVQQSSVGPQQPSMALQQRPMAPQTPTSLQQSAAAPQPPVNPQQQPQQLPALPAPPGAQSQSSQALQQQPQPPVFPNGSSFSSMTTAPSPQSHAPPPYPQQQPSQPQHMQSFYNQPPHLQQQYSHYQPEGPPFGTIAQGPQPQGLVPLPQGSQLQRPHQVPSPPVYHLSETSYTPTAIQPGPPPQPQSFQIPPQQHGGLVQQMYDQSYGRSNSRPLAQPAPYLPQAQPLQGNPIYGSHALAPSSAYNNPNYTGAQPLPGAPGGGGYSRFPVAQPIQQSSTHAGVPSGQPLPQNRVLVDDVIEKVASMGFSREQVQTVVRRLTESGQSADLNVVLDKLMNGGEAQPQRAWFGR
ncbi:hypothetical protein O6H91_22G032900 [Diphasiastrum complanatum]|nr:hypothetical protein O6H91_22G032900 [Diphasiastrum complanatum]